MPKTYLKRASLSKDIHAQVEVTGLYVDRHGRVNHQWPEELSDSDLLDVAQLNGVPLANNIGMVIHSRGLTAQLNDLLQRQLGL